MCHHHGICIWNIKKEKDFWILCVGRHDVDDVLLLLEKANIRSSKRKVRGLPVFTAACIRHKLVLPGILFGFCCLLVLSRFLWGIQISGNSQVSTTRILAYLGDEMDVAHGMWKSDISCEHITTGIRFAFPEVTWVSAKLKGTQLIICLQEGKSSFESKKKNTKNLYADADGVVVSAFVRSGTLQKQVGEACRKGDLLVSGEVPVYNDSGEMVRQSMVGADADIELKVQRAYYEQLPLRYQKQTDIGTAESSFFVQIAGLRLEFTKKADAKRKYRDMITTKQVYLTENFALPFYTGTIIRQPIRVEHLTYTEDEAKRIVYEHLIQFLEKLMEKGVQICENNVRIALYDDQCIASGKIQVIKKAGIESS